MRQHPSARRPLLRGGAALLFAAVAALAASPVRPAPPQDRAQARVQAMIRAYRAMKAFEETSTQTMRADSGGTAQTGELSTRFNYRAPNRFHYRLNAAGRGVSVVSSGRELWIYAASLGKYRVYAAPASMDELSPVLGTWDPPYIDGFAFLRSEAPFGEVTSGRYVGAARLAGVPVDIVELIGSPRELRLPDCRTRLFIGQKDHLLRKTEIRLQRFSSPTNPQQSRPGQTTILISRSFQVRRLTKPVPDSTFIFQPPRGASETNSL